MRTTDVVPGRTAWLLAIVAAAGCGKQAARPSPGIGEFPVSTDQMVALSAEKDSLLKEVTENGKLMSDIATELAKIERKTPDGPESAALKTTLDDRDFVRAKIREVTARVKDSESRLAASQRRVRQLTGLADSLSDGLSYYRSVAAQLDTALAGQGATLAALNVRIEELQTSNAALADTVNTLSVKDNTAYYVIGTRKELLAKGIVVEAGGHFPIFGRKELAPARELPTSEFTSIDRRLVSEIPLPQPDRKYQIVSRQNLAHLASQPDQSGRVTGSIQIASADGFWESSRYLIVVER